MFSLRSLRIKAMQYLFSKILMLKSKERPLTHHRLSAEERAHISQYLQDEIHTIHHLESSLVQLMVAWALEEKARSDKLIEALPTPLYDDLLLTELRLHPTFIAIGQKYPLCFLEQEVIRWYDAYLHGRARKESLTQGSDEGSNTLIVKGLLKHILEDKSIDAKAAHFDPFWRENKIRVKQQLRRFVEEFSHNRDQSFEIYTTLLPQEKATFFSKLIIYTWENWEVQSQLLEKQVKHWPLERINTMDQILIHMALTEINHFETIPHKVSMNEYIEIAKHYSTPKSGAFLNGVIDNLLHRREKEIQKELINK